MWDPSHWEPWGWREEHDLPDKATPLGHGRFPEDRDSCLPLGDDASASALGDPSGAPLVSILVAAQSYILAQ